MSLFGQVHGVDYRAKGSGVVSSGRGFWNRLPLSPMWSTCG